MKKHESVTSTMKVRGRRPHHHVVVLLLLLLLSSFAAFTVKGSSLPSPWDTTSSPSSTATRKQHSRHNRRNPKFKNRSSSKTRRPSNMDDYMSSFSPSSSSLPSLDPSAPSSFGSHRHNNKNNNNKNVVNKAIETAQEKLQALGRQIHDQVLRKLPPEALSVVAGAASFGSTLGLSTTIQQRVFGISTGTPAPIPSLIGIASVCVASTTAHQVALATHCYATTGSWPEQFSLWPRRNGSAYAMYQDQVVDIKIAKIPMHTIRIWTMGLLCFKLLGGRFWAVAPSSLTHVGSFARASLPATNKYASARQRLQIERLGRFWGCHTCGSHRLTLWPRATPNVQFVGDHMPPKSVAQQLEQSLWYRLLRRKVQYRFFPQCIRCSNQQGSLLSKATAALQSRSGVAAARRLAAVGGGRGASYNHAWQPRISHLSGAVLGAIAVVHAHPYDLADENRWRYAQWQQDLLALFWRPNDAASAYLRGGGGGGRDRDNGK